MKRFMLFVIFVVVLGLLTPSVAQQTQLVAVASNSAAANNAPAPDVPATASASSTAIPEPEWPGIVYQLVDNKLVPLTKEKLVPLVEAKTKALGIGGSSASVGYEVKGASCPTIVPNNTVFVVRAAGRIEDIDPNQVFNVDRLTVDTVSGSRKLTVSKGKYSVWSGKAKTESADTAVELNATHHGTNSLRFTSTAPAFLPGEYIATTKTGAFCFRVEQ